MSKVTYTFLYSENGSVCPSCKTDFNNVKDWRFIGGNYRYLTSDELLKKTKLCNPFDRVILSGFWFWRKYCPLIDSHHHYHCPKCNCNFIVEQGNILEDLETITLSNENK